MKYLLSAAALSASIVTVAAAAVGTQSSSTNSNVGAIANDANDDDSQVSSVQILATLSADVDAAAASVTAHYKSFSFEFLSNDHDDVEVDVHASNPVDINASKGVSTVSAVLQLPTAAAPAVLIGSQESGVVTGLQVNDIANAIPSWQLVNSAAVTADARAVAASTGLVQVPLVTGSSSDDTTSPDYQRGWQDGYNAASAGAQNSAVTGQSDVYSNGYQDGYQAAVSTSSDSEEQFDEGYSEGVNAGYRAGYQDGEVGAPFATFSIVTPTLSFATSAYSTRPIATPTVIWSSSRPRTTRPASYPTYGGYPYGPYQGPYQGSNPYPNEPQYGGQYGGQYGSNPYYSEPYGSYGYPQDTSDTSDTSDIPSTGTDATTNSDADASSNGDSTVVGAQVAPESDPVPETEVSSELSKRFAWTGKVSDSVDNTEGLKLTMHQQYGGYPPYYGGYGNNYGGQSSPNVIPGNGDFGFGGGDGLGIVTNDVIAGTGNLVCALARLFCPSTYCPSTWGLPTLNPFFWGGKFYGGSPTGFWTSNCGPNNDGLGSDSGNAGNYAGGNGNYGNYGYQQPQQPYYAPQPPYYGGYEYGYQQPQQQQQPYYAYPQQNAPSYYYLPAAPAQNQGYDTSNLAYAYNCNPQLYTNAVVGADRSDGAAVGQSIAV